MTERKLTNMPYAQARVCEYRKHDGDISNSDFLVSYRTIVLDINYDKGLVTCDGLYSRTTRKHISAFMREKGMDYSIAKRCYEDNLQYNFITGEYTERAVFR